MVSDPLRAEHAAFLDDAAAASNAMQDILGWVHGRSSRDDVHVLLQALVLPGEKQTDALASMDRFVRRARELGLGEDFTAELQRTRAGLSHSLGLILGEIACAERCREQPVDE